MPENKLLLHPPLPNMPHIHNWMVECEALAKYPTLIRMDDDLRRVMALGSSRPRSITDPHEILTIIENSACVCEDLELGVFCWSRQGNTLLIGDLFQRPMRPVQPVFSAFGLMNGARRRKLDPALHGRADVDFTLRTLLEDRIVYADMRFYFDFGPAVAGSGGSAGMINQSDFAEVTKKLARRWGKYFDLSRKTSKGRGNRKRESIGGNIKVLRSNIRGQQ